MSLAWPGYAKPSGFVVDVGIIAVGGVAEAWGATIGGLQWDPGKKVRHPDWDGRSSEVEGMHRTIGYDAKLSGKVKRGGAGLLDFEPGAESDGSSGGSSGNTITLLDVRTPWAAGMYLEDVHYLGRQQDGTILLINMPRAYVKTYKLATKDNEEGEWDIEIVPVLSASETNMNKVPFTYGIVDEA
jgi:hypothetical protein